MRYCFLILMMTLLSFSTNVRAQEFDPLDLVLGYDDLSNPTEILLAAIDGFTVNSVPYFTDAFGIPDPFSPTDIATKNPGFITSSFADLLINENDQIFIDVLDASVTANAGGVGYVNFYNPDTDQLEASGRLAVVDSLSSTSDLIINGQIIESGDTQQFVDFGRFAVEDSSGVGIHRHLLVDLLDDSAALDGAYGVLVKLQGDFGPDPDGEIDVTSEPFWIIWNHNMPNMDFQNLAVAAFVNATAAVELGDFDQDGSVDLADLDRYIGNLDMDATGNLEALDLNSNGIVDSDDFQQFYEQLVETSNGGTGTFAGDINLDGTVNILGDAFLLVASLGNTVTSWGDGDLNGDGIVTVLGDAFLLVANLGNSNTN